MKALLYIALLSLTLLLPTAKAELVNADWKASNDQLAFVDTLTGQEWLDLSVTKGMSVLNVMANLNDGGLFSGWRIANTSEVVSLLTNNWAGTPVPFNTSYVFMQTDGSLNQVNHPTAQIMGATLSDPGTDSLGVGGYYASDTVSGRYHAGMVQLNYDINNVSRNGLINFREYSSDPTRTKGYYGVFLISDGGSTLVADVASPFLSSALMLIALIGFSRRGTLTDD